jgi:hypothetical protein
MPEMGKSDTNFPEKLSIGSKFWEKYVFSFVGFLQRLEKFPKKGIGGRIFKKKFPPFQILRH